MPTPLPPAVAGLETRLRLDAGTLADADLAAATEYIGDATALVLAEVPVAVQTSWSADAPRIVTLIIYKAARREYENPSGLSQEIEGEHTVTTSATSGVFLTATELAQIRRAAGLPMNGFIGTVKVTPGYEFGNPLNSPYDFHGRR